MADTNLLILAREFKKLRTHVQEVLKMPVGPQGLQGEKGEQGVKGDTGAPGKDGKDGKDGVNGLNGQDGRNGADGKDGKDGLDGVGVQNAYIDFDNSLVIVLTSGQEINAGFLSQETKDAVVATFKQGAQTLNELLPVQTGNANKFLKTDGENVSWDTLDGSDINLASPPIIGSTTPNAATFTTLTATGQTDLGGPVANPVFRVNGSTPTQFLEVFGSTTGTTLLRSWSTNGSSSGLNLQTRGGVGFNFATNGGSAPQFNISHTASAVNYVQVTGSATNNRPTISAQGSDTNLGLAFQSKGSFGLTFLNSSNGTIASITHAGSATPNSIALQASVSGSAPTLSSQGNDTNIGLNLTTKGTGSISLQTGNGEQVRVIDSGLATTSFLQLRGGAGGCAIFPGGASSETTIGSSGGFNLRFMTQGITNEQLRITNTASAVNYVQVTGAATGGAVALSAQGSDAAVGINVSTKGNSAINFFTGSASRAFAVFGGTSVVNAITASGSSAGAAPTVGVNGSDTNIDLALTPKGTGLVRFGTYTASMALTVQGYIEIKDSNGTVRKLAVVA